MRELYDVTIVRDVMVPMRDGVRLATDLYVPTGVEGPLPAVLTRTPYDKTRRPDREYDDSVYFAQRGYLAAAQDCRGRYASEGTFRAFLDESEDGYDTVQWLASHPLCDGKIGTHGCSYGAWTQLQLAALAPPALKTMIPHTGPNNAYSYSMHIGGTRTLGLLRWHLYMVLGSREVQASPELAAAVEDLLEPESFLRRATQLPWRRGETPLALAPALEDAAFGFYFEHDEYSDWWRRPSLAMDEWFDRYPAIPILWLTGWWEVYARSVVDGYRRMVELGRPHQHLLAGPWTHHNFAPWNGDANYGAAAAIDSLDVKLRWFDRWLKGDESVDVGEPVQLFAMGGGGGRRGAGGRLNAGGRWLSAPSLDALERRRLRLHLHGDGTLAETPPEADGASTTYSFDPRNTLHSDGRCEIAYGPASELGFSGMGPYDQIQLATLPGHGEPGLPTRERPDVLVFETEPLEADVTVAGAVSAVLHVSSDAPDTDFFVKVIDVYPDGYAFPVTDGILRARFRDGFETPVPLEPGEVYRLEIPLHPVANRFLAGHRIRVDVASSCFPSYDVNPHPARNTVHHDAARPSYVELACAD